MAYAHRQNDQRACGATTIVSGQSFVTVDGKLWAVQGDQNTHGGGNLIASKTYVTINGKAVIVQNDSAQPDGLCGSSGGAHCSPSATGYSSLVDVS